MTKHKPCPFCGGKADLDYWEVDGQNLKKYYAGYIRCRSCLTTSQVIKACYFKTLETKAWKLWNTRYIPKK